MTGGDHLTTMSTKQLTAEAMALPLAEKVSLVQALWQRLTPGCLIPMNQPRGVKQCVATGSFQTARLQVSAMPRQ